MSVSDVSRIASEAAATMPGALHVVGVTHGGRGSNYVEIVLDVSGRESGSHRVVVGTFRNVREDELRAAIRQTLSARTEV